MVPSVWCAAVLAPTNDAASVTQVICRRVTGEPRRHRKTIETALSTMPHSSSTKPATLTTRTAGSHATGAATGFATPGRASSRGPGRRMES